MQTLPYVVITNPHMSRVYELYYKAFDTFRKIPEVKNAEDNDALCKILQQNLQEHLTVIPSLVTGVLECQDIVESSSIDLFMNTLLRSRISRRVIAEQHLALTETFHSPWFFPNAKPVADSQSDFIGEVFLRCNAKEVVNRCVTALTKLSEQAYGKNTKIPTVKIEGHLDATLTYIPSHLEYILGELLRNSFQAVIENCANDAAGPPPIEVLICETPQHVLFRISDRGGGVPSGLLPHLWSFVKGPRKAVRLENLNKVPLLAATLQELKVPEPTKEGKDKAERSRKREDMSLSSLTGRPPNLRLGIGLPMCKVFCEYWAGSLNLHSLEGYGVDTFLQISKLGNQNEQLATRASMDAL